MLFSIIVCTYGRSTAVEQLFESLSVQTQSNFELLVVDANGPNSLIRPILERFSNTMPVRCIPAQRGLTRQRNVGLRESRGELICFLDDDVTVEPEFLENVQALFARPDLQDMGGLTGYDVVNYPTTPNLRWKLKWWLRSIPSLTPGDADHLGRAVPISFLPPSSGCRNIGWLSGFCMIYRRVAVTGLEFDEKLPTYGGEDRDFSTRVAQKWRLVLCGDLRLKHHCTTQGRVDDIERVYQTGYGTGRRFAKHARTLLDYVVVVRSLIGDFIVDVLYFVARPSKTTFLGTFARLHGFFQGLNSFTSDVQRREVQA